MCLDESSSLGLETIPTCAPQPAAVRCAGEQGVSFPTPRCAVPSIMGTDNARNPEPGRDPQSAHTCPLWATRPATGCRFPVALNVITLSA